MAQRVRCIDVQQRERPDFGPMSVTIRLAPALLRELRRLRSAHAEIESVQNEHSMKTAHARRPARRLTPYQAAIKAGLVGCAAGPRDLAENRRK